MYYVLCIMYYVLCLCIVHYALWTVYYVYGYVYVYEFVYEYVDVKGLGSVFPPPCTSRGPERDLDVVPRVFAIDRIFGFGVNLV